MHIMMSNTTHTLSGQAGNKQNEYSSCRCRLVYAMKEKLVFLKQSERKELKHREGK